MLDNNVKQIIFITFEISFVALLVYVIYRYTMTCKSPLFLESNTNITNCVNYNVVSSNVSTRILGEYTGPTKKFKGHLIINASCSIEDFEKMKSNTTHYLKSQVDIHNPRNMNVSLIRTWNELLKGDRIDVTIFKKIASLKITSLRYIPYKVDEEIY
jgi:hypothetical protein